MKIRICHIPKETMLFGIEQELRTFGSITKFAIDEEETKLYVAPFKPDEEIISIEEFQRRFLELLPDKRFHENYTYTIETDNFEQIFSKYFIVHEPGFERMKSIAAILQASYEDEKEQRYDERYIAIRKKDDWPSVIHEGLHLSFPLCNHICDEEAIEVATAIILKKCHEITTRIKRNALDKMKLFVRKEYPQVRSEKDLRGLCEKYFQKPVILCRNYEKKRNFYDRMLGQFYFLDDLIKEIGG